jgi:hypothetical protein
MRMSLPCGEIVRKVSEEPLACANAWECIDENNERRNEACQFATA